MSLLSNDWRYIAFELSESVYFDKDVILRMLKLFQNKWLKYDKENPVNAKHFMNFKHTSPIADMITDRINFWLIEEKGDLYYDNRVKFNFMKYLKYLEIFLFNNQNLVMLVKTQIVSNVMDILLKLDESYKPDRADNDDHTSSSVELIEQIFKCLCVLLRNSKFVFQFL
jgi:hypothetical protein